MEDESRVFQHVARRDESDPSIISVQLDLCNLLEYAFKQAVAAGKPGDWRYIDGVLAKLRERGLDTLEQVEAYEDGL